MLMMCLEKKPPLIIIAGPTGVGKSALAVSLSHRIGGEIISADSIQVYRHMNIGSAKISAEEMRGIPHHLIDVLDPREDFDVARFKSMAKASATDIISRGRIPIVAGGTGFYIQALLYDIDFEEGDNPASSKLRRELEAELAELGAEHMHGILAEADPDSAQTIHPNNSKRVIRAIEYYRLTGRRISEHNEAQRARKSPYDYRYYAITDDRELIYANIDRRVDLMFEAGLVEEVRSLMDMGLDESCVSMQGLGYKEVLMHLRGEISLDRAVYLIKRDTRHFAKRQLTWLRRERNVIWVDKRDFGRDEGRIVEYMACY